MTVLDAAAALRGRRIRSRELTRQCLERIAARAELNAFITVTAESALAAADRADQDFAAGVDRGLLQGIPVAHKDLFHTRGVRTTGGSRIFADFVPEQDAPAVATLAEAGAVCVGKTNLHELAYGITSENPHYGAVRNPLDLGRIAGGSSGGSGAAIAAGLAPAALGTDTGGSIRCPASFCGIVGLKPTRGRLSCAGVIPLGYTLDHVGPMAATVRDVAAVYAVLAGEDPSAIPPPEGRLHGVRIGLPQNFFFERVQPAVEAAVRRAAEVAERLGARVLPLTVPDFAAYNATAKLILLAEASTVHLDALERGETFGPDVRALLEEGRKVPATAYVAAQQQRRAHCAEFSRLWDTVDCLFTPTTPTTAPKLGQTHVEIAGERENVRLATTRLLRAFNMLGVPALSMPCGRDPEGLPVGLQIIAARHQEARLLGIAAALEGAL